MTLHRGTCAALAVLAGAGLLLACAATRAEDKKNDAGKPPKGATVLFDGKDLSAWVGDNGKAAPWKVEDGYFEVAPGKHDIKTKDTFGPDFKVHVEFWLPLMEKAHGQGRANSGVYLQGRYEIQVLDSYKNDTYDDGSVGALYKIIAPNKDAQKKAVKPPEQWNTYDITFHSPRVEDKDKEVGDKNKVTEKGRVTVVLNGVTLIDAGKFDDVTGGSMDKKMGAPGPLRLQDHGCKVRYRNIWIQPLGEPSRNK